MYEQALKLEAEYRHHISGKIYLSNKISMYFIFFIDSLRLFIDIFFFLLNISAVIPAGVNVAYICTQVKAAVDEEQSKALWVPRGPP